MFMPKKNRLAIYLYLIQEGVITVQKDPRLAKHHILDVPNVHVLDALKSLKSREFVREVFNWQWHYYFLTDAGIAYLRQYLHLDDNVMPATLMPASKTDIVAQERMPARRPFGGPRAGDKAVAPGEGFKPRFGGYRREEAAAAPAPAPTA